MRAMERQPKRSFKIGKETYILDSSGVATESDLMKRQADSGYEAIMALFGRLIPVESEDNRSTQTNNNNPK